MENMPFVVQQLIALAGANEEIKNALEESIQKADCYGINKSFFVVLIKRRLYGQHRVVDC
jgi:hypothetical protein